jgi:hypothetical protein
VESLENHGDEGLQAKIDASDIFIVVDLDAEELPCWTEVYTLGLLLHRRLDLDRCIGGRLSKRRHHGDDIDLQQDENAIAADMEVRTGW